MCSTIEHWTQVQNLDEILARSRARYKNNYHSESLPKPSTQNRSRYLRNRGQKTYPGKSDTNLKHASQNHIVSPTLASQDSGPGPYVEHEIPATVCEAEYEKPKERKAQPRKFSTDLSHKTSQHRAIPDTDLVPNLAHDLFTPTVDEDFHESQARQFCKLNSSLGIDDEIRSSKLAEYPHPNAQREASGAWELFDFELDEPKVQSSSTVARTELEGSSARHNDYSPTDASMSNNSALVETCRSFPTSLSISSFADPPESDGDIPLILRPGTPLPSDLSPDSPASSASSFEEPATFSPTRPSPNEVYPSLEKTPLILWPRSSRQQPKLKGYIASMCQRHSITFKASKKPVLDCPREITLTLPTPESSPIGSPSRFFDQGMLMPPPTLHKKKQRQQKITADFINAKELRVRRLSKCGISDEEFALRREAIMQEGKIVFDV